MTRAATLVAVLAVLLAPGVAADEARRESPGDSARRIVSDARFQRTLPGCESCRGGAGGAHGAPGGHGVAGADPRGGEGRPPASTLPDLGGAGAALAWILALATTLLALVALARLWRARGDDVRLADDPALAPDRGPAPAAPMLLENARDLAAEGRFTDAIAALLAAALLRLAAGSSLALAASLTAREAVRRLPLRASQREPLADLLQTFERCRYGGRCAERHDYERCAGHVAALLGPGEGP